MEWLKSALDTAREGIGKLIPAFGAVDAAREMLSEAVAQRIRDEACAKAYELLAQTHRGVMCTIVWQNATLLLSLLPVYFLHSAIPFYIAYAGVAGYSVYSVLRHWPLVRQLVVTRSVTAILSAEVFAAIERELTQRQFYERKVVEWLGPDLRTLSDGVARKLKPDVVAACANMAGTLVLAFVAFRLFAIPLLEHKALMG